MKANTDHEVLLVADIVRIERVRSEFIVSEILSGNLVARNLSNNGGRNFRIDKQDYEAWKRLRQVTPEREEIEIAIPITGRDIGNYLRKDMGLN